MSWLSLTEVSKRFKVNRTTIYRAVNSGKLSRSNDGLFDLSEVIRVFGEAPSSPIPLTAEKPNDQSKLIEVLERELLFLKNQIEQKDKQINSLQLLLETPLQRSTATSCNTDETPINKGIEQNVMFQETQNDVSVQHDATSQNVTLKHRVFGNLEKRIKRFF